MAAKEFLPITRPRAMSFIRRLLVIFRRPRARYGDEVLFAGWVELPWPIREIIRRR